MDSYFSTIYAFVAKFPFVIRRFVNKLKIFHEDKKHFMKIKNISLKEPI